jgi:hypothetical protein
MIRDGHLTAFYLFDVAEAISLDRIASIVGQAASPAKLSPKPATPPYVQYQQPPLSFDGSVIGVAEVMGLHVRVRVYDYGIVSFALSRPFSGSWTELIAIGQQLVDNAALEAELASCCQRLVSRIVTALENPRQAFLFEDYAVFTVSALARPLTADALVAEHGGDIARLLRSENQTLSAREVESVLHNRLSYLEDDAVIPTWNAAFVYDTEAGAAATEDIIEFANSQLLQFRYYDQLLDAELGKLYDELQKDRRPYLLGARRYTRSARQVHALFIDIRELLDRTENALKFVGDIYAARVFTLVGARLGLDRWKEHVRDKLRTLDDIYHFAVEQSSIARGEFLELTIIAILVLELVLFFLGIMK